MKIGIIGLGVGEQHLLAYQKHPDCTVETVCDFDKNILDKYHKENPTFNLTNSADDILCDPSIDIVTIASWDNFHHSQIIKGLNNGKHIFVEKPVCINMDEAKDIVRCLKKNNTLKITSNLILRKSPRFIDLKTMIDKKKLGNIFSIEGDYNYGRKWKITDRKV